MGMHLKDFSKESIFVDYDSIAAETEPTEPSRETPLQQDYGHAALA